jgi:hypothetical protein
MQGGMYLHTASLACRWSEQVIALCQSSQSREIGPFAVNLAFGEFMQFSQCRRFTNAVIEPWHSTVYEANFSNVRQTEGS